MRLPLLTLALLAAATPVLSQPAAAPAPAAAPFVMPETEVWDIASAEGAPYRIFVSRPSGEAPPDGYPVLYVLDGNAMFAAFAEQRRIQHFNNNNSPLGKAIIVAIGYPTDGPYELKRRTKDFTPPLPEKLPRSQPKMDRALSGERDRFARFILERLQPEVARRYPVNAARQSLFGHSLGGLFALHMAYSHPAAFHAIIAASPSIWWNDQAIIEDERAFTAKLAAAKTNLPTAKLLVLVGGAESANMIGNARAFAERLKPLSAYGLRSAFEELAEETHISVPGRAVTPTIRWAFEFP